MVTKLRYVEYILGLNNLTCAINVDCAIHLLLHLDYICKSEGRYFFLEDSVTKISSCQTNT